MECAHGPGLLLVYKHECPKGTSSRFTGGGRGQFTTGGQQLQGSLQGNAPLDFKEKNRQTKLFAYAEI
jgi:hypothetical protein